MKIISNIIILLLTISCLEKNNVFSKRDFELLRIEADSLDRISKTIGMSLINSNWEKDYSQFIKKSYPEFSLNKTDSVSFAFLPALILPKENLKSYENDFSKFFALGHLDINHSKIIIVQNKKPIGMFSVLLKNSGGKNSKVINNNEKKYTFSPETFHLTFPSSKILEIINKSDICFKIGLKTNQGMIYIPGIIYFKNDRIRVYNLGDEMDYPIEEIYRLWIIPDKEKFREFITSGKVK